MKLFKRAIMLATVLLSSNGIAAEPQDDVTAKIESKLGFDVIAVADAPVEGLYQVTTNKGLFYISKDGKYLVQARIYNMDAGMRNETEVALSSLRLDGISAFDDSAIEFTAENEKHTITVFTDITCGYCRKLHREIETFNDLGITVRYLAFPRSGLNSQGFKDMVSVWCAEDQQQAMTDAKAGENVKAQTCKNKVAQQYEFGQQIGVNGTPNIILPDGSLIPGYQPAEAIAQVLNRQG
ncbi:bifunctional protein-disulfide isomerase/oxidoreductase DsbC [Alteromonas sp. H39]|uniref:bifunctional protein-disulfide isomerase/oxidoreductase DsbC n=1 Tax=Alteromonas sp. H39 TaxID=3389876 RepID=UPI0039E0644C